MNDHASTPAAPPWVLPALCIALACLVGLGERASAHAQGSVLRRPALHWVRGPGAEGCADPRALALAVEELVGPVLVRAADAENAIEGQAEVLASGRLRVRLRVTPSGGVPAGERVLEHDASQCPALTPALAFVIAMMIDPGVAAHGLPASLLGLLAEELPEEALLDEIDNGARPSAPNDHTASSRPESSPSPPRRAGRRASALTETAAVESEEPPERAQAVREKLGAQAAFLVQVGFREVAGNRQLWSAVERMQFELRGPLSLAAQVRGGSQAGPHEYRDNLNLYVKVNAVLGVGVLFCAGNRPSASTRLSGCAGAEFSLALARGSGLPDDRTVRYPDVGVLVQGTLRQRVYRGWGILLLVAGRGSFMERTIYFLAPPDNSSEDAVELERWSGSAAGGFSYEF